ncbi:MAG: hypothetical protein R3350_03730 [Saprospiraceae bacterium]|nr:hypothetical protein [Saprospiraceae bacterium]
MRYFSCRLLLLVSVFLVLSSLRMTAQDGHYWSEQYGTRSTLLNGAVIGSVEDMGAVYYNPARLAIIEEPTFTLTAKIYEWQRTVIEDAIGEGADLSESRIGGIPNLAAGTFSIGELDRHVFAYSFLTRQSSETDFFVRADRTGDILDDLSGEEIFSGEVNWRKGLKEEWFGVSWSHSLWSNVSVGITQFITVRNQSSLFEVQLQALSEEGETAFLVRKRDFDYQTVGLRWKMGLALDFSPFAAGVTFTTPKLPVLGNGSFRFEDFFTGVDIDGDGEPKNLFITDVQDDLDTRYRSPLSIGFGLGYTLGRHQLHLSGEWFGGTGEYDILQTDPFVGQSTGQLLQVRLLEELDPVFNVGIGFELYLGERFSAYGSFATDFSSVNSRINRFVELADKTNNSVFRADLFHFAAGAEFNVKQADIILGLSFARASQETLRPINLPDGTGEVIFGSRQTSTIDWQRLRIVFGFTLPLTKEMRNQLEEEAE